MTRLACLLAVAIATPGCVLKERDLCPGVFTPDDYKCGWKFCKDHPDDPACLDASLDGSSPEDGGRDAGLEDASIDADRCACEDPEKPVCDEANTCVECTAEDKSACTDDKPVCSTNNVCVQCSDEESQACQGATPLCDVATSTCVACLERSDCKAPTAPVCNAHACRGCTADDECAAEGKVCREQTGECVACTPDKDDPSKENCPNGNACDPKAFTCTGAPRRSVSGCGACASDSECFAGTRCVATLFQSAVHGPYCLRQQDQGVCPDQYAAKREATSTLGVTASFCFPDDQFTTCEGVLDFQNVCTGDDDCGAANLPDGLCKDQRCTYGCDSDSDCSGTQQGRCTGTPGSRYCQPN